MTVSKPQLLGLLMMLLAFRTALGQDAPLKNWTVPPYHASSTSGDPPTDITGPRAFIGIQPCRVADTRGNGAPIQGGIFGNSQARDWTVWGICGIPSGADAISVNFTVVSAPATPQGGFLLAWPTGSPPVQTTAIMTYGPGVTVLSNAAILPLSGSGSLTVNVSHSTHLIMDVNGYFSDALANSGNFFELYNNAPGLPTAFFGNASSANMSTGVLGRAGASFPRPSNYYATGLRGESTLMGVLGISHSIGVAGSLVNGAGAETAYGLVAYNEGGSPLGVYGLTTATSLLTAGVKGVGGGAVSFTAIPANARGGIWGESHGGSGVFGLTNTGNGVVGAFLNNTGSIQSYGILGCTQTQGLCAQGSSAVTGLVTFVEPHPVDAARVVRYAALQGNESGTYFRGRGRFEGGLSIIEVPEDFRIVTDPEGLSIQVTPIGEIASVAVQEIGLERIVVKGSRDVEFFYLVHGIRHAYRDAGPYDENRKLFVPGSPDEPLPAHLPQPLKERLISNGTYRPDGKVNMETAQRLGWDKVWEQRSRPRPVPQPADE